MLPRRRLPCCLAACATSRKRSIDSAIEQLMFFCENASDAEPKITTSSAPAASAASKPFMFGVSTEYTTPGLRVMPAITSAEVAICGTHLGDTKEAASMLAKPACVRRLTSSILTSTGMVSFSFCRPSRGPTSTIFTLFGNVAFISISSVAVHQTGYLFAALQCADLVGNLPDTLVAQGQRRDMRRQRDARLLPERMRRRQRLLAHHVQRGAGDMPILHQRQQIFLDQMGAARDVDQVGAVRQFCQCAPVQQIGGVGRQWQGADQHPAVAQELVQFLAAGIAAH